ncbi:hypothetical protein [Bosea sp. BK604]|uniref:hypothetical protein n=1 Tax=Bosea sp. BK604 TaxID=2512180 RepID=UPI00104800A2|nr:hypothetical protein [Bosea sp. BK604]TCR64659.1 hypothetical protein EV560_106124 [Bosea sp. BK604]
MTFTFAPAANFSERAGLFVALTGGTNSGKTFSALELARGIAGPNGKIAVLDTEGGRTLHLKDQFQFDVNVMDPPFRPERFAAAAIEAENAGYAALVIDSFSMEWVGIGGVLDWQAQEITRMAGDDYRKQERMKMASWIKPKSAHKAMVYSFLQRRMPIIFSIRGEESVKPGENPGDKPTKTLKSVTNKAFPFEMTVAFWLETERKGYIDLSDPKTFKMEGAHRTIFNHGDRINRSHGAALEAWAKGQKAEPRPAPAGQGSDDFPGDAPDLRGQQIIDEARIAATDGMEAYRKHFGALDKADQRALVDSGHHETNKATANQVDKPVDHEGDETLSLGRA